MDTNEATAPTAPSGEAGESGLFDVQPDLGARTTEPSLREIVRGYYAPHFKPEKVDSLTARYLTALSQAPARQGPAGENKPLPERIESLLGSIESVLDEMWNSHCKADAMTTLVTAASHDITALRKLLSASPITTGAQPAVRPVGDDALREALGAPHCYVVPGRDTANDYGAIDAGCCEDGELNRPLWAFEDIARALAQSKAVVPMGDEALREALGKAQKALKPFSARVFNDNGDISVTDTYLCGLDEFTAAYFAHRSVVAALAQSKPDTGQATVATPRDGGIRQGRPSDDLLFCALSYAERENVASDSLGDKFVWQATVWAIRAALATTAKPDTEQAGREDTDRLDWLDQAARKSRTGISFDHIPSVEGERSGFRFMRKFFIGDTRDNLRAAIDSARAEVEQLQRREMAATPATTAEPDTGQAGEIEVAARCIAARRKGGAYCDGGKVTKAEWTAEISAAEAAVFALRHRSSLGWAPASDTGQATVATPRDGEVREAIRAELLNAAKRLWNYDADGDLPTPARERNPPDSLREVAVRAVRLLEEIRAEDSAHGRPWWKHTIARFVLDDLIFALGNTSEDAALSAPGSAGPGEMRAYGTDWAAVVANGLIGKSGDDVAAALRHVNACGYTEGYGAGKKYISAEPATPATTAETRGPAEGAR